MCYHGNNSTECYHSNNYKNSTSVYGSSSYSRNTYSKISGCSNNCAVCVNCKRR